MKQFSATLTVVVLLLFLSACDTSLSADKENAPALNERNNQQQASQGVTDKAVLINAPELSGSSDQGRFALSWDSTADIAFYQVYRSVHSDPQAASLVSSPTTAGYQGTLAEGTNNYWIKACTQVRCSDFSNMVSLTRAFAVPEPVTEYSAYRSTDDPTTVSLGWQVPASHTVTNGVEITYRVYRHTSDNSADAVGSLVFQGRSSVFTDTGLEAATSYYYWIEACTAAVCSQWSDSSVVEAVEAAAPASVPVLSMGSTENTVTLSWNQANDVTYYKIYRDTISNPSEQRRQRRLIAIQEATADSSYQDLVVSVGTTYYYWVKACNTGICSAVSNVVDVTVPAAPALSAVLDGSVVTLTWKDSIGGDHVAYYEIYRSDTNDDEAPVKLGDSPLAPAISYSQDVSEDARWFYWVKACNDDGLCSDYSNAAVAAEITAFLNDSGVTWGGDSPEGNNTSCTGQDASGNPLSGQDCHQGRDYTHNDDSDGHAGFSFTRLNASGDEYTGSGSYSSEPWACVQDNVTGLVWEVKTDDGTHDKDNTYKWGGITATDRDSPADRTGDYHDDWNALVNWSRNKSLCGYSDWRVPTPEELNSIANAGRINPAIDADYFPNTNSGISYSAFWSSAPYVGHADYAWSVNFSSGLDSFSSRRADYRVRLVRGSRIGSDWSDGRYTVLNNGTVTDNQTGLMWKQCVEGLSGARCANDSASWMNWQDALAAAENSDYAGYTDWRLPNRNELLSLVARDRVRPSVNSSVFPDTPSSWLWSSTPYAYRSYYAWAVNFGYGYDGNDRRGYLHRVRLVRGGQ